MVKSRFEQYVVRKPAIVRRAKDDYIDEVPAGDIIPVNSPINTGPRVIFSNELVKGAQTKVEYGYISGDTTVGNGQDFVPHKHDYAEIFLFLGTNPADTTELGAEVEFWLGEGAEMEKVTFKTSACVFVPPGTAHFPQVWRNVRRPVMTMVIMPTSGTRNLIPVDR